MTKPSKKSPHPIAKAREGARRGVDLITGVRELGGLGPSSEWADVRAIEIGERIRAARLARGWTQSILARKIGCAQGDLSDLERGKVGPQGPSLRTLVSIADALDIELPITPESTDAPAVIADTVGDVRRVTTDYCTANAMFTAIEWESFRKYASAKSASVRVIDAGPYRCTLWTLGSHAQVRNLRATTPSVVAVMRGDGHFGFHAVKHHLPQRSIEAGGVVGILDINGRMEVSAVGDTGLTMMMVPVQSLMQQTDDDLAC